MSYRYVAATQHGLSEEELEFLPKKLIPNDIADVPMTVECPHCGYKRNKTLGGYIDGDRISHFDFTCVSCGANHEFPSLLQIERLIIQARRELAKRGKLRR